MYDEQLWTDYENRTPQTDQEQLDANEQAEHRPTRASAAQMAEARQNIDVILSDEYWMTADYYHAEVALRDLSDARNKVEMSIGRHQRIADKEMGDGLEV